MLKYIFRPMTTDNAMATTRKNLYKRNKKAKGGGN
jgi:hypothetical protein